jgi:Holliday junction DNA helicase RuvB
VVDPLSIAVKAAQRRGEPLDHILFHGPPGLGKTTLAHIIAREMESHIVHTSGPALERPADVVGLLSNLKKGDVIFIDEIHRLSHAVEEYLYSAMEDYRVDFVTGSGAFAKTISLPLEKFTLIGSTTRAGMLSAPLRDRFGLTYHLEYYAEGELAQVVKRSAGILGVKIEPDAAAEVARRSRGTPRISNRLLRRVRDYAEVHSGQHATSGDTERAPAAPPVSLSMALDALKLEGVDGLGLDRLDRMYLTTLAVNYQGGPAGVEALAASLNEEQQTLVDVVEPFLLKIGFIVRTPAGRKCTAVGMSHAGAPQKSRNGDQPRLD